MKENNKKRGKERKEKKTPFLLSCHLRLRLNSAHYDKMKELFRRARAEGVGSFVRSSSTSASSDATSEWTGAFHDCLFACLMRYEALQVKDYPKPKGQAHMVDENR